MATLSCPAGVWCSNVAIACSSSEAGSRLAATRGEASVRFTKYHHHVGQRRLEKRTAGVLHAASAITVTPGKKFLQSRRARALSEEAESAEVFTLVEELADAKPEVPTAEGPVPEPEEGTLVQEDTTPKVKVTFNLEKEIYFGQTFNVVGSSLEFGEWDVAAGVPMVWSEGHIWSAEVAVPVGQTVEYKFVLTGKRGELEWQPGENHVFETSGSSDLFISEVWDAAEPPTPEESEEVAAVAAQESSANGLAPGSNDLLTEVVAEAVAEAVAEETSGDNINGKLADRESSEVPLVEAVIATAVAEVSAGVEDPAAAEV